MGNLPGLLSRDHQDRCKDSGAYQIGKWLLVVAELNAPYLQQNIGSGQGLDYRPIIEQMF